MIRNLFILFCIFCQPYFAVAQTMTQAPLAIGTAKEIVFESKVLNQTRKISVHLPASYENSDKGYPTLYLLDGERHLAHAVLATGLYQELNMVPELIIVAVENLTEDGARENDLYHQKNKFADFLGGELRNYVDATFRTTKDATLYGHSLAAYFTVDLLANRAHLFDRYIAASPPLQRVEKQLHLDMLKNPSPSNKVLYITMTPEAEEGASVYNAYTNFISLLSAKSPNNLNWHHEVMKDQNHISNYYISFFKGIAKVFE